MKRFFILSLFVVLNFNAILAFESLVSLLDFEKRPGIDYYNNLFKENDFYVSNDTLWMGGEPKYSRDFIINQTGKPSFNITLDYTPKLRLVYCAHIKGEVAKERFVSELLKFYIDLINKYELPDKASYRADDPHYISNDKNEYFAVETIGGKDTTKIKQFFEQARPFYIVWEKKRFHVSLMVDKKYNVYYSPDFTCMIIDHNAESIYAKEMSEIKADKQQKEDKQRWINIGLVIVGILVVFFLGRIIIIGYLKQRDIEKKKQKVGLRLCELFTCPCIGGCHFRGDSDKCLAISQGKAVAERSASFCLAGILSRKGAGERWHETFDYSQECCERQKIWSVAL